MDRDLNAALNLMQLKAKAGRAWRDNNAAQNHASFFNPSQKTQEDTT